MSEVALRRVIAAVVVLGLLYLGIRWIGGDDRSGPLTDDPVTVRFLEPVREDTVTSFRIRRPELGLEVARGSGGWRVNRYGADTATVGHFIRSIRDARVEELASRNPQNHPALGVAGDSSWTVRVVTGRDSTPLLHVGQEGPYPGSAYVRVDSDDRVYLVRGGIRSALGGEMIRWRKKQVAAVDTARVAEIHVQRPGESYRLHRGTAGWRVDDAPASPATVDRLLAELHDMEAYAFATDTDAVGEQARRVQALDARGDTLAWIRAAPGSSGTSWFVRSSRGEGAVFRVEGGRVERVSPPRDSLTATGSGS